MGFRPLPGFCVSQYLAKNMLSQAESLVSVPFRGSVFLNSHILDTQGFCEAFPSPSGVLCFSIGKETQHD